MDAADLVRDEPELVEMYGSNLPAIDLDALEWHFYELHRAYVWPGWVGALRRRLDDLSVVCGVFVGWWA